jgi:subtilisin family serine protease
MRVMDSAGHLDSSAVVNALTWLARPHAVLPSIVLMAFGRQARPDDPTLDDLRCAVRALTDQGVTVVASAGNGSSSDPVYPAAFAAEPGIPVVSVGAIQTRHEMAPYSNFGPWVKVGWLGSDIVSIHPQTISSAGAHQMRQSDLDNPVEPEKADSFAWWTGTSFAAAIVAAGLAAGQNPALTLPLPPAPAQP